MKENNKKLTLFLLIALTSLPFFIFIKQPQWSDSSKVLLYLSSVVGYIGISLMVWQLVIGTRSIAGLFFKDLPGLLKIHSFLGKYGTILVFTHPIFYILSSKLSFTYLFNIHLEEGYERYVTLGRLAFFSLIIIWLTSAIVRGSIKYRPWKYIHYLSYPALGFSLLHIPDIGNSVTESGVRFMWLGLVAVSLIAFALRMRHLFGYGKMKFELIDKKEISPSVRQFQLKPLNQSFKIGRGQYIYLQKNLWGKNTHLAYWTLINQLAKF